MIGLLFLDCCCSSICFFFWLNRRTTLSADTRSTRRTFTGSTLLTGSFPIPLLPRLKPFRFWAKWISPIPHQAVSSRFGCTATLLSANGWRSPMNTIHGRRVNRRCLCDSKLGSFIEFQWPVSEMFYVCFERLHRPCGGLQSDTNEISNTRY